MGAVPRVEVFAGGTGSERSPHGQFAPSLQDTASRLSIKIVRRDHHRERTGKLMEDGQADRDGGTGTFLGLW